MSGDDREEGGRGKAESEGGMMLEKEAPAGCSWVLSTIELEPEESTGGL